MTWHGGNGSGCDETPKDLARINRSVSFYLWRGIPIGELEQTIGWLDDIRADCEFKIREIKAIKNERERSENWRRNINRLAKQFYDEDALHLDLDTRVQIVQQRLNVRSYIARHIAERVQSWATRKRRKDRNSFICIEYKNGISMKNLAKKHNISRQQVHNIVKNDDNKNYLH